MPYLLQGCLVGLSFAILLGLIRLARGPTIVDRILAFDLVAVGGVGAIAVVSVLRATPVYLELIMVYSLLGFLGTVALTRYLQRTRERRENQASEEGGRRA